ncbi:hypothetical protein LJR045_000045 [Microbacterium sp. LjRoot45]|uniref:hypothetical protein n=1 Tax=Microbacterium sp. LjRoot45 TaxID=3342329 RepID=UPI003ED01537
MRGWDFHMKRTLELSISTAAILGLCAFGVTPAHAGSEGPPEGEVVVLQGEIAAAPSDVSASTDLGNMTLFAWPAEEVLAAAAPGEAVKLTPIATAEVNGDGEFSFTVPEGTDFDRFAGGTDHINVSMAGVADGEEYWYSTSINAEPTEADSEPDAENPLPEVEVSPTGDDNSTASTLDTYSDKACYTSTAATYSAKTAQVGYTANSLTGGSAQLKFSSGATAKFGVGISSSGAYGSFSASGTTTLTSNLTIAFGATTSGARTHHVYLVPKKYKVYCESNAGIPISTKYELRPASYTGGSASSSSATFSTNAYCTPSEKNTTTTIDDSTASTMSLGFKTSTIIGVDLSSQSGFNKNTSLVLKTPAAAPGKICGEKGYPGGTPGRVKLKP